MPGIGLQRWLFSPADPRAYAAVRIGYAITAFFVLLDLWPLRHHLCSAELGPAQDPLFPVGTPLNVFAWIHSPVGVTAIFLVAALATATLALGVATRLSALVVYVWSVSYSTVALVALGGFDTVLRVVGFCLVVSPTVRTWSLGTRTHQDSVVPAYGLRMMQWQVMLIYLCTFWLKAPDHYWRSGEVLAYFWMSMFSRAPSPMFADLGFVSAVFTYATLLVEASLAFLLWQRRTRFLGVALGFGMHAVIALTAKLALFSLAMIALYPAFFERTDFEWIARRFRRRRSTVAV